MDACETAWSRFAAGNHVGRVAVIRVAQPGLYVDISTEIGLGVIVAATVNHIILPSSLGPQLWQAVIGGRQALADYALARSPDHRGGWKGKHLRQGTCHYPDAKEYAAGGITDRRVRLINRDHSVWQGS